MVVVAVEVLPVGSKPLAAVSMCISTGARHGFGAAAPLSIKTASLQEEREVQLSCRNWSNWSGRFGPYLQNSYPHASLELQQWRPPPARKSSCLLSRLPPWRDVAAERLTQGLLNDD